MTHRGFSLVEMLVAMAVVVVLVAISVPALSRGRERAKDTRCLGNMDQWGKALLAYGTDHTGKLPPARHTNVRRDVLPYNGTPAPIYPGSGNVRPDLVLRPTMERLVTYGATKDVAACPSNPGATSTEVFRLFSPTTLASPPSPVAVGYLSNMRIFYSLLTNFSADIVPNWSAAVDPTLMPPLHDPANGPLGVAKDLMDDSDRVMAADMTMRWNDTWTLDVNQEAHSHPGRRTNDPSQSPIRGGHSLFVDGSAQWFDQTVMGPLKGGLGSTWNFNYNTVGGQNREYWWGRR